MAINPNKFLALPPSKSSSLVVGKKTAVIQAKEKIQEPNKSNKFKIDSRLLRIEKKVIKIDTILKDFLSTQKSKFKWQAKEKEAKTRENRENELEKNVKKPPGVKLPIPKVKLGLFDWIKNFISNAIMGFIAVRLIDQLPKLVKLIPIINKVMNGIIDWGGKLLDGLVTFIDWGYKAIDASRMFVSNVFGESGVKAFDDFAGKFKDVINYSLIAAMLISSAGDDIMGGFGKGGGGDILDTATDALGNKGKVAKGATAAKGAGVGAAGAAAIVAGVGLLSSALGEGAFQLKKFGNKGVESAKEGYEKEKNPFMKPVRWLNYQQSRFTNFSLGTIGTLLDIVGTPFRYAIELIRYPFLNEEDKEKQAKNLSKFDSRIREQFREGLNALTFGKAFKEKGSFGNIFGNESAQTEMISKMAGGGPTRGGKNIGDPKRTIKKKKATRTITPPSTSLEPGRSVGGNQKLKEDPSKTLIETYYPNKTGEKEVKPYQYLHSSHKNISKVSFLGSLFGLVTKTIFGDKPSQTDYLNVSQGLNSWINVILGRLNPRGSDSDFEDQDLRNWLAITIQNSVNPTINKIIGDLMKQLLLKPMSGPAGPSPAPSDGKTKADDPNAEFQGQSDFVIGDNIAHGFAGRSGDGTDTSDSKKGRKPAEVLAILKSKGDELKGKLVDLSTGIAHSQNDWAIVEEQLKYLQSVGARVRLLGVGKQWDSNKGSNQVNTKLQQLASQYGAYFYGGHDASGDKEFGLQGSPAGYGELKERLTSTQVSDSNVGATVTGGKAFPLPKGMIGTGPRQVYGAPRDYGPHAGVDVVEKEPWGRDPKLPVVAYTGGKVVQSSPGYSYKTSGYTSNLTIDHGSFKATYLHMKPSLRPGQTVQPGQKVGNLIDLGINTHLHFEAYRGSRHVDPTGLLRSASGAAFHGKYITGNKPQIIKTHDGEFVIDKDSVEAFGIPFIDLVNRIENKSQIKGNIDKLMTMLDYEDERPQTIVIDVYEDEVENHTYIVNKPKILSSSSKNDELSYLWDSIVS